ncbi:TPA: hypothetical protein N0F65_002435 [Lagenidium giganteum]|uniref:FYVE-type domain-containing protein n=1 Tax=Lagenidium giganteum TaxID=4803 RepID=A0AAV2YNG2_9STRA|nr:TPA: hypothetical protein N0F65_002435 [Lagenidium giganteum]
MSARRITVDDDARSATNVNSNVANLSAYQSPPRWVKDEVIDACSLCSDQFDLLNRKHHCRACGLVYCKSCAARFDRVIKLGFREPVRVCNPCFQQAKCENVFYDLHLPVLEKGEVFTKYGMLRSRLIEMRFLPALSLFQQHVGDVKAIALDSVMDVRTVCNDKDNADLGFVIITSTEQHRFDASTREKRQQWVDAISSARDVRQNLLALERDKQAKIAAKEHEEVKQYAEQMQILEEKKASFHEDRMKRRAEKRESLRLKYNLAPPTMAAS